MPEERAACVAFRPHGGFSRTGATLSDLSGGRLAVRHLPRSAGLAYDACKRGRCLRIRLCYVREEIPWELR